MAVNVFTNGDGYITNKVLLHELSLKTKQNTYTSFEQIGLTQDTASTYKIVHDALGVGDKLVISWTGTSTTNNFGNFGKLMPAPWGTCVVEGGDVSSWKFYPYGSSYVYIGSFTNINDNGWYGWVLNADSNNYLPLTGGTITNDLTITSTGTDDGVLNLVSANNASYLNLGTNNSSLKFAFVTTSSNNLGTTYNNSLGIYNRQTNSYYMHILQNNNAVIHQPTTFNNAVTFNGPVSNGSDEKIKKNIETLKNSKDFIMNLNPIKFVLKDDSEEKINFGFTAQNVQKSLENLGYINTSIVSEVDQDGETILALSYIQLIAPLIKVVQEQEEKIKELEEKIGGLL